MLARMSASTSADTFSIQLTRPVVVNALTANGIKYASFDTVRGRKSTKDVVDDFIKDKSITVFLLHAERER
jgi:hypothetical protein